MAPQALGNTYRFVSLRVMSCGVRIVVASPVFSKKHIEAERDRPAAKLHEFDALFNNTLDLERATELHDKMLRPTFVCDPEQPLVICG
ncbi:MULTISPECIES: hypothetical protein [Pseudomonas syringae group]|uniref:Uncharacterized protein n=1 Tax=Pseudomonas syringae pv. castaneae TaxID=264450 RepID=A0A0N8R3D1_PSESX|nr:MULTISPECIES: hypothetical protein [Pseudomonas syringae group]KPW89254.1 Unknown protein sequence [Pseudomonas syringae pv. castaneae]KWS94012.1 hypothetical protein AL048_24510 [Pseudomonas syringae pv. castaneae]